MYPSPQRRPSAPKRTFKPSPTPLGRLPVRRPQPLGISEHFHHPRSQRPYPGHLFRSPGRGASPDARKPAPVSLGAHREGMGRAGLFAAMATPIILLIYPSGGTGRGPA